MDVRGGTLYLISLGLFERGPPVFGLFSTALWLSGMYATLVNVLMQFFYRFNVLCMRRKLSRTEFLLVYCVALCYAFVHGFAAFYCLEPRGAAYDRVLATNPMYRFDLPAYAAADSTRLPAQLHFLSSQAVVGLTYAMIIYTGRRISQKLRDNLKNMSQRTLTAQKRLTNVMVLQVSTLCSNLSRSRLLFLWET